MCSLTMQYHCKTCQCCFLAVQYVYVLVIGTECGWDSRWWHNFLFQQRGSKGNIQQRGLLDAQFCQLWVGFDVSKVYLVRRFEFQRCGTLRSNILKSVKLQDLSNENKLKITFEHSINLLLKVVFVLKSNETKHFLFYGGKNQFPLW